MTQEQAPAGPSGLIKTLAAGATILLTIGALGFASLALYLRVSGHPWTSYQTITCAAIAVACALATRLSAGKRVRVAMLAVSSGLSLYGLEFYTFTANLHGGAERPPTCLTADCDARPARTIIADLERATGRPVVPAVNAIRQGVFDSRLTPLAGVSDRETIFCHDGSVWITFHSDEHGFRNPPGTWTHASPKVAVIGDSFVEGTCAKNAFMELVRAPHPGIVNLGAIGAGPLAELGILKEYAAALRPATILWVYYEGNDIQDLSVENRSSLRQYLETGFTQRLVARQAEVDDRLESYFESRLRFTGLFNRNRLKLSSIRVFLFDHFSSIRSVVRTEELTDRRQAETVFAGGAVSPEANQFVDVLREAQRVTRTWDGKVILVYLPAVHRFQDSAYDPGDVSRGFVLKAAADLGWPVIDLLPAFSQTSNPRGLFSALDKVHYTAEGNALVARQLLRELESRGVLAAEGR